jgi:hypothetical protein
MPFSGSTEDSLRDTSKKTKDERAKCYGYEPNRIGYGRKPIVVFQLC